MKLSKFIDRLQAIKDSKRLKGFDPEVIVRSMMMDDLERAHPTVATANKIGRGTFFEFDPEGQGEVVIIIE